MVLWVIVLIQELIMYIIWTRKERFLKESYETMAILRKGGGL